VTLAAGRECGRAGRSIKFTNADRLTLHPLKAARIQGYFPGAIRFHFFFAYLTLSIHLLSNLTFCNVRPSILIDAVARLTPETPAHSNFLHGMRALPIEAEA
jgi:hypothetical protein